MKTERAKKGNISAGFTLVEVFVVMAILAILATMGWQASGLINNRQMNKTAELQVSQMEVGMNAYRIDNGEELPAGDGDVWSSHVLYTTLNCDADGDGNPDTDPKTQEVREPYCDGITPIADIKNQSEVLNGIPAIKMSLKPKGAPKKKKLFVLLDPWGTPYRYRMGYEMRDEKGKTGKGVNPDFDIFSLGVDASGNGLSNEGKNEDNISNIRSWR